MTRLLPVFHPSAHAGRGACALRWTTEMKTPFLVACLFGFAVDYVSAEPSKAQLLSFDNQLRTAIELADPLLILGLHFTKGAGDYQIDCAAERVAKFRRAGRVASVKFISNEEYDRLRDPRTVSPSSTVSPSGDAWHRPGLINGKTYVANLEVDGYFVVKFVGAKSKDFVEHFLPVGTTDAGKLAVPLLIRKTSSTSTPATTKSAQAAPSDGDKPSN